MKRKNSSKSNHHPKAKAKPKRTTPKPITVAHEPANDYYTEMEPGETLTEIEVASEIEEAEQDAGPAEENEGNR